MLQLTPRSIRIVDSYEDGQNAKHVTFEPIDFIHEQPVRIGQFFMLSVPGAGLAPFTYTSLPDSKGRFVALIRKVGKLTKAIYALKQGAVLGYNGPYGQGWPIEMLANKEVLIVAGGCGIAPLAATIDHLIEIGRAGNTTLIYGAKDRPSQVLSRERRNWQNKILVHDTFMQTNDADKSGTPTQHIENVLAESDRHPQIVLTCGPEAMMRSVAITCHRLLISSDKIWLSLEKRMRCGIGLCGHCYLANELVCKQGPTYRYDKLLELENKTTVFHKHTGLYQYC
ncbi:hypothetical protein [Aliiglaciecola litoralis]|uniref:Anaerobic sulfite reductase subunit AsrB n=1 Tax=Aliiglaciecola litoralis TaxID=582857 RepID=A0ABP3X0S7_9ALTE